MGSERNPLADDAAAGCDGSADRFVYATLVTSDAYVDGALVLLHSLRRTLTPHSIVCLATPSTLSEASLQRLRLHFDGVIETGLRQSSDDHGLALLGRPDLWSTLTKLQLWDPALFGAWSAVCYLDADTLVRQPIDDIFSRFERWRSDAADWGCGGLVAAAPDTGWPDCFNSGVLLLAPGRECHQSLCQRATQAAASFDGADQGLLNEHFADWSRAEPYRRLPFLYNATANVYYTYPPALQRFGHEVRIVHFIGVSKPWHWARTPGGRLLADPSMPERWRQLVGLWWNIHDEHVSGWRYWQGPFDKAVAFGEGYRHITDQAMQASADPPAPEHGLGDDEMGGVCPGAGPAAENLGGSPVDQLPEVPDWDKDWSWAADRVHPFDYAYLAAHAAPGGLSTPPDQHRLSQHVPGPKSAPLSPQHTGPARDGESHAAPAAHPNDGAAAPPDQWCAPASTDRSAHEQGAAEGATHGLPPPQWMQSQRPWEDVAREGWMHQDEYRPHEYDQAYVERHMRQAPQSPSPQPQPQSPPLPPHEQHRQDWRWVPEHSPAPAPNSRNLYEATQVLLLPRRESTGGGHPGGPHQHLAHAESGRNEHHIHRGESDYAAHAVAEDQPSHPPSDRRDSQSTTSSSPLFYPQPKSPIVVNPVALWESNKEQARRRAWAQHVRAPQDEEAWPPSWSHSNAAASGVPESAALGNGQRAPLSTMDHIDSSHLPQETPWKISHVRQRPSTDVAGGGQPPHAGMQFKEGVASDTGAREAAGQILQRWNEAIAARTIGRGVGGIRPEQIAHSAAEVERGTDAIRLETTVSCEAEDSRGERTVYRFTLSSTLDVGGAQSPPTTAAPAPAHTRQQPLSTAYDIAPPGTGVAYRGPAAVPSVSAPLQSPLAQQDPVADEIGLRSPATAQKPAISRRSSFSLLQANAARAPYLGAGAGGAQSVMDQFAESDARYWRLQRQLIDLEMSQQFRDEQTQSSAGSAQSPAVGGGFGMVGRGPSMLEEDSPPTPLYQQLAPRQSGSGQLMQRRPSAFSVALLETLASTNPPRPGLDADHVYDLLPPVAPRVSAAGESGAWARGRSRSSPRLAARDALEPQGVAPAPPGSRIQAPQLRGRSHSGLRLVAVQNSVQALEQVQQEREVPQKARFTTSGSDSEDSEADEDADASGAPESAQRECA
ncbi:glycogenin glucosyltransferase [Coemansia biformis]|uniref:glycogenin glucosyltransferase n=1 Tax=Coemansia biformis TaxID=1286918 RepID=A0A9W7YF93_9FUNG|nr:glycogenin glucosyltransferase [Coemansia biformis]